MPIKLITSALPYANGPIHCGHLVEYIQTDIYVRFLKLLGEDVVYCCADDTHGAPIEIKASELGIRPEELIAKSYKEHKEDFEKFFIDFDSYYTTNSPENKQFADLIFTKNKQAGNIYTQEIEVTYCENCSRFLPDRYVKGACPKCGAQDQYGDNCEKCGAAYKPTDLIDPVCVICGSKPVLKKSVHYFFKTAPFAEKILAWLERIKAQEEIVNYVKSWIKDGLKDWDISRDAPYFGFLIPGETSKYYYVWMDAPIGYIASFEHYTQQKENIDALTFFSDPKSYFMHVIGKDITYFHFLFWPAMLLGAKFTLPSKMVVHGFLTVNGEKMSKSRGTFLTAKDFAQQYNPELLRFYYAKNLSLKLSDLDLNIKEFIASSNNEVIAIVINFCHRVLKFLWDNYDGKTSAEKNVSALRSESIRIQKEIKQAFEELNYSRATKNILLLAQAGNRAFQELEPWKNIKTDKRRIHQDLTDFIVLCRDITIVISPILPQTAQKIWDTLNIDQPMAWSARIDLTNHKINEPKMILEKLQEPTWDEFPLDLKVGKIVEITEHPQADKLFVLSVDLGNHKRQLVAGLRAHYKKEELQGKHIVVVSNLKPAKLRGVESFGMLLAGDDGEKVRVVDATGFQPGTQVIPKDMVPKTGQIKIEDVQAVGLKVDKGVATAAGKILMANGRMLPVGVADGSIIK